MQKTVQAMKNGSYILSENSKTELIKKLETENAKLAYQAIHLERVSFKCCKLIYRNLFIINFAIWV